MSLTHSISRHLTRWVFRVPTVSYLIDSAHSSLISRVLIFKITHLSLLEQWPLTSRISWTDALTPLVLWDWLVGRLGIRMDTMSMLWETRVAKGWSTIISVLASHCVEGSGEFGIWRFRDLWLLHMVAVSLLTWVGNGTCVDLWSFVHISRNYFGNDFP